MMERNGEKSVCATVLVLLLVGISNTHARSAYFWHVTDFHYDHTYWTSQRSCNANVSNPGQYGDYWCDSPWLLVEDSVKNMAKIKSDVEFVIWTGDTVAHIKDPYMSLAINLEILENTTKLFNESFPSTVQFYPSLGNHDFYPSDQAEVVQDEMYNKTAEIWKQWIKDDVQVKQFMAGGFYHNLVHPKLRLLALNTNLYFKYNKITKNMIDPAGQFAWMKNVLNQSRADGEKVIITAHVTPGIKTPDIVDWMYPDHQKHYLDILTQYSDIIVASHYGHDHSDGFKVIQDSKDDSKAITQFIAPSVTPWRFKIPGKTGNPHNPGIRLVEYDPQTGLHINYIQYFINLTDTNARGNSSWAQLYSFKDSYGAADMSVKSLRDVFSRMEKKGGENLSQKYCNYAVVSVEEQYCPEKFRWEIICGGRIHDIKTVKACVDKFMVGDSSHITCSTFFFVAMTAVPFIFFKFLE